MRSSKAISRAAQKALEELKAENALELDVRRLTEISDYFIIATARSGRHLRAMSDKLHQTLKRDHCRVEGDDDGADWIVVDCGGVVVHLMTASAREFYNLEELWSPALWETEADAVATDSDG